MKAMIAVLVGIITFSMVGVAAAGSRCEPKAPKEPKEERAPHSVSDTLQKAHDTAKSIIQNIR